MPNSIRPGDLLAGRYRLIDLLAESEGGRFWRAHDRVLERHVALHVLDQEDQRAEGLMEAARRSATVHDRRLLRVLDADRVDGVCYVVNEWGSGHSLDTMLATEGPLGSRRAAWLVSEVAASVTACHTAGVAHGRLVPENVLVDRSGSVRLIGFAVDAALHGLPPGRLSADVADLGGLLYAALTGRWPGVSTSSVPRAPVEQGRVLRPRQVRAGIPRPLDALCDEVVNPYAAPGGFRLREPHDFTTAKGIADFLAAFVGDPTGLVEAEAEAGRREAVTVSLPALADPPVRSAAPAPAPEPEAQPEPETQPAPVAEPEAEAEPQSDAQTDVAPEPEAEPGPTPDPSPAGPRPSVELPTEAGLPIFVDGSDDVSWITARRPPAPPPPPFEDPPERPLFAPDPPDGRPARTPRPAPAPPTGQAPGRGYWPWDTGAGTAVPAGPDLPDEDEEVPGRSWLRLAGAIAACVLLVVAIVVSYNLGRGRTPLGAIPDPGDDRTPSQSASPASTPITGITATDFDPQGTPPSENPAETGNAVDGNPATSWETMRYLQQFGPGGLKTGVGLVLDLGARHEVSSVDLTFVGAPTGFSLYVTDQPPTTVDGLTPAARETAQQTRSEVVLDRPATGRYVTIWLTSLPAVPGGFRGGIAEVSVRG